MANLLQLRRMVRTRLGVTQTDAFFRDDKIDDAINNAIVTFEAERNWPWQLRQVDITLTDATGVVPLPTDWQSTRAVWQSDNELTYVAPYDLQRWGTATGDADAFSLIGRTMELRPRPATGTVITHQYHRTATLMSEDTDEPDMPANSYPAIVAKAAQLCSTREDDRPSAQAHLLEYEQWLQRLVRTTREQTRPVGRRIRRGSWI